MKLLILANIHGNLPALEAVLNAEPDFDAVAFAGDVVDYGPNPAECIRWLRDSAHYKVRGSHDNALAYNVDCVCLPVTQEYSSVTRAWHRSLVSESDVQFLRTIPTVDWFGWEDKHFRMAHGTPFGSYEFLPMDRWEECIRGLDNDFIILGNSHVQGMRTFGKTTVINPGSVGLARDHVGNACYGVLVAGEEPKLKHVSYHVERTVALLNKAPLPAHVIEGLSFLLRGC